MKASDDAFHPKIPKYHFCWGSSKTCIVPLREAVLVLLPLSISEKGKIEAAISWSTVNQGKCSATAEKCQSCPPKALAVLLTCMLVAGKISFSAVQIFRLRNSSGLKLMLGENSFGFFFLFSLGRFLDQTACTATWTLTRFQGSCMKTGTWDGSR